MKLRIFFYGIIGVLVLFLIFLSYKSPKNDRVYCEPYSNYPDGIYFRFIGPSNLTPPVVLITTRELNGDELHQLVPEIFMGPIQYVVSDDSLKGMKNKIRELLLVASTDFGIKENYPNYEILLVDRHYKVIQTVSDQNLKFIWKIVENVSFGKYNELCKVAKGIDKMD